MREFLINSELLGQVLNHDRIARTYTILVKKVIQLKTRFSNITETVLDLQITKIYSLIFVIWWLKIDLCDTILYIIYKYLVLWIFSWPSLWTITHIDKVKSLLLWYDPLINKIIFNSAQNQFLASPEKRKTRKCFFLVMSHSSQGCLSNVRGKRKIGEFKRISPLWNLILKDEDDVTLELEREKELDVGGTGENSSIARKRRI